MTAPTIMLSREDLDLLKRIHGHLCGMVLLGARTARTARAALASGLPFGFYRGFGCAVDGIQIFSGCTTGNGNLVLLRGRDHSFCLTTEGAGEGILVSPLPGTLERIRNPESRDTEILMEWLGSVPDDEILLSEPVSDIGVLTRFPGE